MVSIKAQIDPNAFSYITLSWLTPLLVMGNEKPLVEDDLPELADKDKAEAINVKFDSYWKQLKEHFNDSTKPKPSLARSLFSILSLQIIAINLLAGFLLGTTLSIPYVLQQLIIFVDPTQNTDFLNNSGIVIAGLLFGLQLVATTITAMEQSINRRIFQVLRSAVICAIYEKSLRLSPKSQMLFTEGKVMNLVNQDTVNLLKAPASLVALWQIPLQLLLSVYFLYRLLGNSIWAGAITLGALTGITTLLGPYSGAALQGWFKGADARIGIIREMLMNMKVVKYQTMQDYFREKIIKERKLQEESLTKFGMVMGISQGLGNLAPILLSTISFVIYAQSNPMKASIIFPALSYFAMLFGPLMILSWLVSDIPQAFISLKRIEDFLSSEELIDSIIRGDASDSTSALTLEKVTWRWEETVTEDTPKVEDEKKPNEELKTPDAFHLRNFNAVIPKGQLIGIVGATGSGKSSFFSGLIGESIQVSGEVTIYGKVAYCSQLAWIMSGSIEKNILFNLPLDEDKLQKVVEVSGLLSDLKLMSDGLKTMIGES
ncbi:ABC transporter type 1, transmembrane domain-containing protein, partial [Globomyces pollinis-pini]